MNYRLIDKFKQINNNFAYLTVYFLKVNEKTTNAVILRCIDTRHSPTCFGTLKCHHQGVNHDPAEIGAQCCRNQIRCIL
jgi:hypothetical protein